MKCAVCEGNPYKYRCPRCRIVYCSVSCYKQHKAGDSCTPGEQVPKVVSDGDHIDTTPDEAEKEEGEVSSGEDSDIETGTDQLKPEQVQRLGESEKLKSLLQNPHLRALLTHVDQADDKGKAMEGAMQEPLFAEFADACLVATVDNDQEAPAER